jgi:hypothetical protein
MSTRKVVLALLAAVAVGMPATAASASPPPPIQVSTSGSCPDDYFEIARSGNVVVCGHVASVRVTTTGCNPGEFPILVLGQIGACVS